MAGVITQLGIQLLVWSISASFNLFLLPLFAVFWVWSYVTGYARKLMPKDSRKSIGSDRVLRKFGTHRYIQLKVRPNAFTSLAIIVDYTMSNFLLVRRM